MAVNQDAFNGQHPRARPSLTPVNVPFRSSITPAIRTTFGVSDKRIHNMQYCVLIKWSLSTDFSHFLLKKMQPGTHGRRRICYVRLVFGFNNRISSTRQYNTGTTSIVITSIAIPPNDGIAICTMMSEPRPCDVNTGNNARTVVAGVIKQGRIRRLPVQPRT